MARLFEREDNLAAIAGVLGQVRSGRGRTLLIEGPPGIGKTALLGELERRAEARGHRVLRARGSELEQDFGYGLVRQLFGPLLRALPAPRRAELFAGPGALAAAIFGFAAGGPLEAGGAESSLYGLFWMLATLAEKGPLVLAVDDAHWGDAASLRFARYLGQRLDGLPVLVALAARPNEPGGQGEVLATVRADDEVATTRPALLSPAGTGALVRSRLAEGSSPEVEAALHEATGGNPFLIEELIAELEPGPAAPISPRRIAGIGPGRIATAVIERAGRVDERGPDVVRAIAVLGTGANLRAIASLAGTEPTATAAIVDALATAAILADEPGQGFVHPLLASAVYGDVPAATREVLHARAAGLLRDQGAEPEAVAAHLLRCEPGTVPGALDALDAAAASASDRGAPDSAASYLRRALAEPGADRAELLLRLGGIEVVIRDPAAIPHLQEAAELSADPEVALGIYLELADLLSLAGQWELAEGVVEKGLAHFEDADLPGLLDLEAFRAAYRGYDPAWVAEFHADLPRLRELVAERPGEESKRLRWALAAMGAIRDFPRAEVIALIDPPPPGWSLPSTIRESSAVPAATCALLIIDALPEAETLAAALSEDGRRRGSVIGMVSGVGFEASRLARLGDLRGTEADLNVMTELVEQNDLSLMALTTMVHFCIDAIVERRGLAGVAEMVEGLELPPEFSGTQSGGMVLEVRGALRAARGERAAAVADLRASGAVFAPLRAGPRFTHWRARLALALPEADHEEALALAAEEHELARAVDSPRAEGIALRALGVLRGGEEGIATLRDSVAVLRDSSAQLELARSLAELGAALRRGNQRGEARERLRQAAELAQRCGAERLEERVHEELRIAGARPRRRALSGAASLTPSERRVAGAAAGGATNREIAQDLFVSLRTVEMHLTNAYRKLDISSRSELAAVIEEGAGSAPPFREA